MKWQAINFFKSPGGLSRNEPVEIAACLDYEQALQCGRLVQLVKSLSASEKEWMLCRALGTLTKSEQHEQELIRKLGLLPRGSGRLLSRFVPHPISDYQPPDNIKVQSGSSDTIQSFEQAIEFPPIPAVCVAACWFPEHWLEAPPQQRRAIVDHLQSLYPINRFGGVPFPLNAEESSLWVEAAKADRNTLLYVIAIDHSEPNSVVVRKFKRWLEDQKIDVSAEDRKARSRRGKVNIPARLDDLACYRLSSLEPVARETAMIDTGFRRSVARLSAAKRRAEKRLRALNYI